ncbi:MAG: hypothetical protein OXG36_05335 [Caldilineaceae bacterium]|nr:hypothetical protein [Caldilineaceae bacterium]
MADTAPLPPVSQFPGSLKSMLSVEPWVRRHALFLQDAAGAACGGGLAL